MLLDKGKITKEIIAMLSTCRHSGFNVFCGNRISPDDDTAMENLARYIIRASFSQERMQYLDQEGTVVYTSKDGATTKSFPALEWLAAMCSHIPNRGEQMVRYYGWYSNASWESGRRKAAMRLFPAFSNHRGMKNLPAELGAFDSENLRSRSHSLSEVPGDHADHQLHRRRSGNPDHPRTPGIMAGNGQAAAKNT